MKKTIAIVIAAAFCLMAKAQETMTVPLSSPGKPYSLNVHLVTGSIKVTGYEGKDIQIEAQSQREESERRQEKGGMKRLVGAGNSMDVSARENENKVTITSGDPNKTINLVIRVPQEVASLKVKTVNGGDVNVSNVNGELEVGNVNGEVIVENVSGSVVANTINGKVKVAFRSVDPKAAMAFSSLNGDVDVTLPASVKLNIKAKSDRGDVYSDFDVDVDKTAPKANKTTDKGMYRINIEDWIQGKVNGGGPEMMLKNMNGNIYLRKAK